MNLEDDRKKSRVTPYTCCRMREPIEIDGCLDKPVWENAPKSPRFVDVVSGVPSIYDTRSAVLWDEANLYVAFWCEEPFVTAEITERDALVFLENDVEVFIDGGDTYYEFELNALGTIYEVFFIWQDAYKNNGRFRVPEFDLVNRKALSFGGNHDRDGDTFWRGSHPRGNRWAFLDWDFPGLQVGVQIDGKINDPSTQDKGWTAEIAFPWSGMPWLANGRSVPPQEGDIWRIFFGRYQKFNINGSNVNVGWGWDPIGSTDNHYPERFTPIKFSNQYVEDL